MVDVIIVGAGTAGLHLAKKLSDLDVVVLEKKKVIGEKACSGLYSTDMEEYEKIPKEAIEHRIERLVMHSSSGKSYGVKIKQRPWVVDRKVFNKKLAERIKVKVGEGAKQVSFGKVVVVKTDKGEYRSKLLVGADGGNSFVRNSLGVKPKELVTGLIIYKDEENWDDHVDVWIDKDVSKDGFLWKIPRGRRTEYGLLGSDVSVKSLEKFFNIKGELEAAVIPAGFHKTYFDKTILLGDAASQTKPWSLGGVLYGFIAGDVAEKVIRNFLVGKASLEEYEDGWKEKIGSSIEKGLFFRKLFKIMDNKGVDEVFDLVGNLGIKEFDMDHPFLNIPL